jgi:hypothetical protein
MARSEKVRQHVDSPAPSGKFSEEKSSEETSSVIQPSPPVMVPNRPSTGLGSVLRAAHGGQDSLERLAGHFLRHLLGIGAGQAVSAEALAGRRSVPRDCQPEVLDTVLTHALFGNGDVDRWIGAIAKRGQVWLNDGPAAYADGVMRLVFSDEESGALPAVLERFCVTLDRMILEVVLDHGLDLAGIENLCSQASVRFLCNTVLLPRLRVAPEVFHVPVTSIHVIDECLAKAFDKHSAALQSQWMKINDAALSLPRKQRLGQVYHEASLQEWIEDHQSMVDMLGRHRNEFIEVARTCPPAHFNHWSFVLLCLLRTFQSYPLSLELEVQRCTLISIGKDGSADDRQQLVMRRMELRLQRERWSADLQFIRRQLTNIDRLGEHGREYLLRKLVQLAQAEYRPLTGALDLRQVIERARRQGDAIREEDEPDQ